MGARIALARAFTLHDSNRRPVPLEFSLAAIFPSRAGDLRGGSLASKAGVTDPGYSGAWTCRLDRRRSVDLPHNWFVRFSAHLDCYWTGCGLGLFGISAYAVPILDRWTPAGITFCAFLATYLCVPTNCGVPRYNFLKNCLNLRRSIHSGFISAFIHGRSLPIVQQTNRGPVGQTLRPGSTSMWAGLRFINGYSPIRAAGVAREFANQHSW